MTQRVWPTFVLCEAVLVCSLLLSPAPACCPAPPSGKPVVNADQTVIIIWDAANKTPPTLMGQLFHLNAAPNRYGIPAFYALHEARTYKLEVPLRIIAQKSGSILIIGSVATWNPLYKETGYRVS